MFKKFSCPCPEEVKGVQKKVRDSGEKEGQGEVLFLQYSDIT